MCWLTGFVVGLSVLPLGMLGLIALGMFTRRVRVVSKP